MKAEKRQSTTDLLEGVVRKHNNDHITVGEVMEALHERGFGLLLAIASIPLCFPVPVPPGYTTLFSIPLFFFSVQLMMGLPSPWLPQWIMRFKIKRKILASMVEKAAPPLRAVEKILKPRLTFAATPTGEKIIGAMAFIFSISIALPIPMTNFIPGWGIMIMAFGLMAKDGLMIIAGMIVGWIGIAVTCLVLVLGQKAAIAILHQISKDTGVSIPVDQDITIPSE